MSIEAFQGVMIPFLGTVLGSSMVFFAKGEMNRQVQRALTGFAAGVMTAASVWSLLIPAMNHAEDMGKLAFIPAAVGFWIGILFLLILDRSVPHMHMNSCEAEGPKCRKKSSMLVLAVTLHNLPEGMAVERHRRLAVGDRWCRYRL
ncbi:MAG: ZIP family metal transporter [Anaerovoracaceae bacterium]